jgi:SAM-dependent methyltransferase
MAAELSAFIAQAPLQRGPIAEAVRSFARGLPPGSRVLDAGAGAAPYRPLFAHCDYRTQDWPGSVHPGARAADVVGDLHALDVPDASFDAILCTEVLEHVAQPERVVAELHRLLADGGALLVTVPFVGPLHEEPHDHYRYTSHGVRGLLERGGFTDLQVRPLSGYWSALAHLLRFGGLSTTPLGRPARPALRAGGALALVAGALLQRPAPWLDRHADDRRALPIGWAATARRGAGGGGH